VEAVATDLPQTPMLGGDPFQQAAIEAGPAADGTTPTESPLELAIERDRIRDEVAELVDNQPNEVAAVIQGWLAEQKS
jgi:flagellar M-ring protein FliF